MKTSNVILCNEEIRKIRIGRLVDTVMEYNKRVVSKKLDFGYFQVFDNEIYSKFNGKSLIRFTYSEYNEREGIEPPLTTNLPLRLDMVLMDLLVDKDGIVEDYIMLERVYCDDEIIAIINGGLTDEYNIKK